MIFKILRKENHPNLSKYTSPTAQQSILLHNSQYTHITRKGASQQMC